MLCSFASPRAVPMSHTIMETDWLPVLMPDLMELERAGHPYSPAPMAFSSLLFPTLFVSFLVPPPFDSHVHTSSLWFAGPNKRSI
jgi:hypothetical protein